MLEATSIASGASGKAGGLLAKWAYPSSIVPLSFRLHSELAAEHDGAAQWGYRMVGCGSIELEGRKERDLEATATDGVSLEKLFAAPKKGTKVRSLPEDLDWVVPELVRAYEPMAASGETAQVHPYRFTMSMMRLAEEAGAKVVLGRATQIQYSAAAAADGGRATGVTYLDKETKAEHTLLATHVVITAGPWTARVLPSAPIQGQRAHSITITPAKPVSAYCLFTEITTAGSGRSMSRAAPEMYARPNNEVYICGEGDREVALPETAADVMVDQERCEALVKHSASVSDHLRYGEVTVRQACYLPVVSGGGNGPLIGETGTNGLLLAAGHTCWGINNGPATGKIMSEFVFDGKATSANVKSLDPRNYM